MTLKMITIETKAVVTIEGTKKRVEIEESDEIQSRVE